MLKVKKKCSLMKQKKIRTGFRYNTDFTIIKQGI